MLFSKKNMLIHAGGGLMALALMLLSLEDLWALDLTKPVAKVNNAILTEADLEKAKGHVWNDIHRLGEGIIPVVVPTDAGGLITGWMSGRLARPAVVTGPIHPRRAILNRIR